MTTNHHSSFCWFYLNIIARIYHRAGGAPPKRRSQQQPRADMLLPRSCFRFRVKLILSIVALLLLFNYFGVFTHMFELDFNADFSYPMVGDVRKFARQLRHGQRPDRPPINLYNYTFLETAEHKCAADDSSAATFIAPRLVFIIKSAMENVDQRNAIRSSWGFERRMSDVTIRTVFMLGTHNPHQPQPADNEIQRLVEMEIDQYQDIVQADFHDSYYNNTIKIMMSFKWAIKYCPRSKFYMFVDDDFYISTKNVLRFVRNPVNYPEYLEEADETLRKLARRLSNTDMLPVNDSAAHLDEVREALRAHQGQHTVNGRKHVDEIRQYIDGKQRKIDNQIADDGGGGGGGDTIKKGSRQLLEMELADDVKLFSGFVFSSWPHRHKSSKWYVPLEEYPWHMWPPYVTGGAFILSREALNELYYVSMFTKHFR